MIEKGVVARYGYTKAEEGLDWLNSFIGHLMNLRLLWMDRNEMLYDLVTQLPEPVEYPHPLSAQM